MTRTFIVREWLLRNYQPIGPCVVETSEPLEWWQARCHLAVRFPDNELLIVAKDKFYSAIVMPVDESYA